jgi:hypothetical protein
MYNPNVYSKFKVGDIVYPHNSASQVGIIIEVDLEVEDKSLLCVQGEKPVKILMRNGKEKILGTAGLQYFERLERQHLRALELHNKTRLNLIKAMEIHF